MFSPSNTICVLDKYKASEHKYLQCGAKKSAMSYAHSKEVSVKNENDMAFM